MMYIMKLLLFAVKDSSMGVAVCVVVWDSVFVLIVEFTCETRLDCLKRFSNLHFGIIS